MTMTDATTNNAPFTDAASVDSQVIKDVFYDEPSKNLYVRLHRGTTAAYRDVPRYIFENLVNNSSAGQYWNWFIKGQYRGANGDVTLVPREAEVKDVASATEVNTHNTQADEPVAVGLVDKYGTLATRWVVQVEVEAENFSDAVQGFRSGNVVGVTRA